MMLKRNPFMLTILTVICMLLMCTSAFAVVQYYPSDYTSCYMPYHDYQPDDFCNASRTPESSTVRSWQTDMAKEVFKKSYKTTSNPRYTNMWGTYSSSQGGAHEGLDMIYGSTGQPIYHWGIQGQVVKKDPTTGLLAIYCSGLNRTIFYRHMDTIKSTLSVGSIVYAGDQIGTQGDRGNSRGVHLHTGTESGNTTSDSPADIYFNSADIYETMDWVLHG